MKQGKELKHLPPSYIFLLSRTVDRPCIILTTSPTPHHQLDFLTALPTTPALKHTRMWRMKTARTMATRTEPPCAVAMPSAKRRCLVDVAQVQGDLPANCRERQATYAIPIQVPHNPSPSVANKPVKSPTSSNTYPHLSCVLLVALPCMWAAVTGETRIQPVQRGCRTSA